MSDSSQAELRTVLSAEVIDAGDAGAGDAYRIRVPEQVLTQTEVTAGEPLAVGFFQTEGSTGWHSRRTEAQLLSTGRSSSERASENREAIDESDDEVTDPPVSAGDRLTVEIDDIGDEGDGVAQLDSGYVLFVPDTEVGDKVQVKVEVEATKPRFGFASVRETRRRSS